jgi:hypothetical protein
VFFPILFKNVLHIMLRPSLAPPFAVRKNYSATERCMDSVRVITSAVKVTVHKLMALKWHTNLKTYSMHNEIITMKV